MKIVWIFYCVLCQIVEHFGSIKDKMPPTKWKLPVTKTCTSSSLFLANSSTWPIASNIDGKITDSVSLINNDWIIFIWIFTFVFAFNSVQTALSRSHRRISVSGSMVKFVLSRLRGAGCWSIFVGQKMVKLIRQS